MWRKVMRKRGKHDQIQTQQDTVVRQEFQNAPLDIKSITDQKIAISEHMQLLAFKSEQQARCINILFITVLNDSEICLSWYFGYFIFIL